MWTRHILQELAEYSDGIPTLEYLRGTGNIATKKNLKTEAFFGDKVQWCAVWMGIPSDPNDSALKKGWLRTGTGRFRDIHGQLQAP